MKPQLLRVTAGPSKSFSVRQDLVPYINNRWHYHPEVELIHFKKGHGTQFVGDNIRPFSEGDIVLVGRHLPHYWRFDDAYFEEGSNITADVRVAHFTENFWGDQFLNLPENKPIKLLLERSHRGIQVNGRIRNKVASLMQKMVETEGPKKIILLVEALTIIADSSEISLLSSIGFKYSLEESENNRINAIYEYSFANFKRKIHLEEIADIAGVSPNSFCRYFKSKTRKTFSQFLLEIKVGHACKLLIENKLCLKQLCYESGFNNFSSFHKYFKLITGKSPLIYQKEFISASDLVA